MGGAVLRTRSQAVELLRDCDLTAHEEWPKTVNPPVAIVVPGEPYIEPGERFGSYTENVRVFIIMKHSSSHKKNLDDLDAVLDKVIPTFSKNDVPLGEVETPEAIEIDGTNFYAVSFQIKSERSLQDE